MNSPAGDDVALLGAQPRQRLVVAHLALRQRDDRLQIKIDAVGVDRLADQVDDALAAQAAEAAAAHRVAFAQRQRAVGGRPALAAARRRRHGALLLQHRGMAGDRFGELPHQPAQFADLGGDRIDRAARPVHGWCRRGLPWRRAGGAISATWRARSAVPRDRSAIWSPRSPRSRRRLLTVLYSAMTISAASATIADVRGVELEAEIEHGAERAGDEHHADRNEDGADTHA